MFKLPSDTAYTLPTYRTVTTSKLTGWLCLRYTPKRVNVCAYMSTDTSTLSPRPVNYEHNPSLQTSKNEATKMTPEQQARDLLERMGIEGAEILSAGGVAELANVISEANKVPELERKIRMLEETIGVIER